ncbi:MAG: transglycosylase domain-containing protein, partial [Nitrososphaera sp.]|nr:transglycosylase domain-containing protein [Nitrososphaera sp.]
MNRWNVPKFLRRKYSSPVPLLKFKVPQHWGRLVWRGSLWLAGIFLVGVIGVFAYFAKDLPSPGKINKRFIPESTKIFDRTGEHLLYEVHGEEKRTIIPFEDIPEVARAATITLEDQDFYTHHGIKLRSIARAILTDIYHREAAQGASTITQQFVKNSLLTNEKTLTRKIKEVILSIEMEQKFSKDEILGMYLNEIPYGSNAYGIEAAAQTFFGKHAKELSLDEAALLASLPQAPSRYSPYGSRLEELKARQEYTLRRMMEFGYITSEQAEEAIAVNIFDKLMPQREAIAA